MRRIQRAGPAALLSFLAGPLAAQAALTSDLWRVAAGTVTAPAPLVTGPSALLWTPVVTLNGDATAQFGLTSYRAPEEIGVSGGAVSASVRVQGVVVSAVWGRLGIDGIARTETSPETVNGTIEVDAQVLALGATRQVAPWLVTGIALRAATERLGSLTATRGGVDAGALVLLAPRLTVGATVRAIDPLAGGGEDANVQAAAEGRTGAFRALGELAVARLRYGATVQEGEEAAHLVSGGVVLADALSLDVGAVREARAGNAVWRSRVGLALRTRLYEIQFGRDGGVNGFGPTYALGLAARFR